MSRYTYRERLMADALAVISTDARISAWLAENDPKAMKQVEDAIEEFDAHPGIVSILFTDEDIRTMVEDLNDTDEKVDLEQALEAAEEWGRHIESTACELVSE